MTLRPLQLNGNAGQTKLLTDLPKEFIDTGRLGRPYVPDPRIQYVDEKKQYIFNRSLSTKDIDRATAAKRAEFIAKINEFQVQCKNLKDNPVNLREPQTWEHVENLLIEAAERYSEKKGVTRAIEKFFTKLGKSGDSMTTWLSLLPDGEYTSIVFGAFKLIVSVCHCCIFESDSSTDIQPTNYSLRPQFECPQFGRISWML